MFLGVERGRYVVLTTLSSSVSRLSRNYGTLNISQPCRHAWPVAGIALPFFYFTIYTALRGCVRAYLLDANVVLRYIFLRYKLHSPELWYSSIVVSLSILNSFHTNV
jgi:hypothetical protein